MEPEDLMMKNIIDNNLQRKESKIVKKTDHELKIDQADGGFFQAMTWLVQDHKEKEERIKTFSPKVDTKSILYFDYELQALDGQRTDTDEKTNENGEKTTENAEISAENGEKTEIEESSENGEPDDHQPSEENGESQEKVDIESRTGKDSDSEAESQKDDILSEVRDTSDFVQVGWNIDELYLEILYEILHNVGCDITTELSQTSLFSYLQDAFKMAHDKHSELMDVAEQKEAPDILLNVEIIEAKDLVAKDSNGLSDPFVTLYLMSNSSRKYNTSVRDCTLTPLWEEHFALQISDNVHEDTLCLEVWDFDPAETVREKLGKVGQIKGVKGFRKLVKELAVTATTGQHDNELIGKVNVPLKAIPATGLTMWYGLEKKNKLNRRGLLKVRLTFSSEKNSQVASQEHRHLLRILLLHELELSKVTEYWWCGTYTKQAETILTQHGVLSGLNATAIAFAEWTVFCSVHIDYPLSFTLFVNLLDKLIKPIQTNTACEEDIKYFWDGTKKLLSSCFTIIRKMRKKTSGDKNMMKQLVEVLRIIGKLTTLEMPDNVEMFPEKVYPWLNQDEDKKCDLKYVLNQAVVQGASHWLNHVLENNNEQNITDEEKLAQLVKIIQLVRADLQKAIEYYDKIFQENVNLQYAKVLYCFYEAKLAEMIEPEVKQICGSLEKMIFEGHIYPGRGRKTDPETVMATGTTLFELYLILQRFVLLGTGLCQTEHENFAIRRFHLWFHAGVHQWLNIAVYKMLDIIKKAVEVDNLVPVDDNLKYSSSAVDTLTTFYQVKTFWQQLNWPDVEGSYIFIAKIIDDICRSIVFFADQMSERVKEMGDKQDSYEKTFEVTTEWCLAINNIDFMRQALRPFTDKLELANIIQQLADLTSPIEAERCKQTLHNVIENALDTVRNKIIELLETVAKKMFPAMTRLLVEGAEILHQDSYSIDKVMRYLDDNFKTLFEYLNDDNFNRTLDIFWDNLSKILYDLLQTNLEKRRPPTFFANLNETLKIMLNCFKQNKDQTDGPENECEELKRIEYLLALNGMETYQLIHQVELERWRQQRDITNSPFGQLSIRIKFEGNILSIEIMNARNLKATDSNGFTDSFIRVHLLPEEKFTTINKPKTKIHNKTLFPLYDETFHIELTPEQRGLTDALVLFSVKDNNLLMSNEYIAEAYVHFLEIPKTSESLQNVPQMMLELHRPKISDSDAVKALEHRQGDKLARDFLKKLKQRIGSPIK